MKDFILRISFDSELEDVLHGRLFLTGSTGSDSSCDGVLSAYFVTAADRDTAADSLCDLPVEMHAETLERTDWLDRYQQSLHPLFIGRSFVVAPEVALIPTDTTRHQLVIPQEQAFGTGSHESTALSIELLEELDLHGIRGLDVGAGSGILALAMLRLGARKVFAFDIDLDAFRPLRENRGCNGIAPEQMPIFIGGIEALRSGRFDVIVMNILPEVIVPMLADVKAHLGGVLVISGILTVQRAYVLEACEGNGLLLETEREKGEWWAARLV